MHCVFWLIDGLIAGRPGPDLESWNPRELADAGFRSVLSIHDEPPNEAELSAVGIRSVWHPLPLHIPPNQDTADRCRAVLPLTYAHLSREVASGRPVLVHCLGGCDRTGLVLAYFVMRKRQISPDEAIAEVQRVRPPALSMPGWHAFAVEVLSSLSSA